MSSVLDQPLSWATGSPRRAAPPPVARPLRARPEALLALIAVGAIAVIALWWSNTPHVSGFGDWLTNAGRIVGLLAGYSVVVLLALMARIPALERGLGADRLARWHSMGGRYTVSLVVAHALLILWGYAITAHTNVVHEGWTLLNSYPDVLMATVAGFLFLGVGIVSMRAARRRVRYETWYYLHLYTYLAVALAFSHQFADGAEFLSNAAARWAWATLYIAVAVLLIWYRIVVPLQRATRHRLRVVGVVRESPHVVSILMSGDHLEQLQTEPGQFFRFRFLTRDLWWASNPYSVSAPIRPGGLMRITVKDLGDHSRKLAGLRPGTRVFAEGPYGALTGWARTKRRVLLIAGGVGITPLRGLFETLPMAAPGDITLVYRSSDPNQVLFRRELEALAASRQARLHILTGTRKQLGGDPLSAQSLARFPGLLEHDVYVCGPDRMEASVLSALRSLGVPRRQVHTESFTF